MYSGRIIFKVLAKLKQFNLAILPASNHRNIPYIPNSLYSLFGKTYPFDILLTEKRSACLVAGAPFVVPVIHFCFDFRSRHILSALSRSPRGWAKTEKNSFMTRRLPLIPPEVPNSGLPQHIGQCAHSRVLRPLSPRTRLWTRRWSYMASAPM